MGDLDEMSDEDRSLLNETIESDRLAMKEAKRDAATKPLEERGKKLRDSMRFFMRISHEEIPPEPMYYEGPTAVLVPRESCDRIWRELWQEFYGENAK